MKQGWEIKTLGEVVDVLDYMRKPITKRDRVEGVYPYYGATGILSYVHNYIFSEKLVLIGEDGAKWLSGDNTSFIAKGKYWVNNHAHVIRPKRKIIIDEWLVYFLNFSDLTPFITGMTVPKLNQEKMRSIPIPIPPLPEQKRIVALLDEAFGAIAKAKANAEQNLKNAKELFESYLQSVFENKGGGWEEKTLGDVAITNGRIGWKGLTAKEYTEEGPLFISVHSLNYGDYVDFRDAFHISQKRYDESPEIMLKKDDILICKDGAGIGKLGIIPELPDIATINSSLLLIRCRKQIFTKYLYYNLLSPLFQRIVQSRLSGATTPHLYQRDIVTFPILLPNLSIQKSIVQKLDALSAETKRLEAIYQQKINDLEELKKSILQKAFSGELTAISKSLELQEG